MSRTGPGRTGDDQPIALLAEVDSPADLPAALAAGAEGVGLLRTEFLFLDAVTAPSEKTQEAAYRSVFDAVAGRRVVIRVLDAGADVSPPFLGLAAEPNPALGVRGLRALRAYPELLRSQLTAAARAAHSTGAEVWVLAPLVTDVEDAHWFVDEVRRVGLDVPGVTIEVPAAALTAGTILRIAAFASVDVGTLAQYTLAADRGISALARYQDPWHPGVLRLVELVGAAGTLAGKPVGVSGTVSVDPLLACVLVGLGATSLSLRPSAIADVRDQLARFSFGDCVHLAALALRAPSAADARRWVRAAMG